MRISQEAFDLIVAEEVSSEATYRKKYTRPEWPGGQSGVTIGIGYDVGYSTPDRLRSDWKGSIPNAMIEALVPACGVTRTNAQELTKQLQSVVNVPWEAAIAVFEKVDMPRWERDVIRVLPEAAHLSPDCLGALVSLAYNRGLSFNSSGDRYAEMRQIRDALVAGKLEDIPDYFRKMKRLWPNVKGLINRREHEAVLFERGLRATEKPVEKETEPAPNEGSPDIATETKSIWDKWSWMKELSWAAIFRQGSIVATGALSFVSDHKEIFITAAVILALYALWNAMGRPNPFKRK